LRIAHQAVQTLTTAAQCLHTCKALLTHCPTNTYTPDPESLRPPLLQAIAVLPPRQPDAVKSPTPRSICWVRPLSVAATLAACGAGCALFDTGGWTAAGLRTTDQHTLLKPIGENTPDAVRLEYVILERPVGDPLLGDQLWEELVEMGVIDHAVRRTLNEHGIRVGVASTSPPQALQKLLGEAKEIADSSMTSDAKRRLGQTLLLPSGGQTEAQTSDIVDSCTLPVVVDGKTVERTFEKARGVFRVTATTKQEGWAKIDFLPEIHHGNPQTRPVPGQAGWQQFETSQSVLKLFGQRFELTLNEGEAAVVTSTSDSAGRAGRLFFGARSGESPMQRILVVKLIRTGEAPRKAD
jgi:hypothetical protein